MPRPRFRIRTLMIAVAAVGVLLWCLRSPAGFVAAGILSYAGAFLLCMTRFHGHRAERPTPIESFHAVVASALFCLLPAAAVRMLIALAMLLFILAWLVVFGR